MQKSEIIQKSILKMDSMIKSCEKMKFSCKDEISKLIFRGVEVKGVKSDENLKTYIPEDLFLTRPGQRLTGHNGWFSNAPNSIPSRYKLFF